MSILPVRLLPLVALAVLAVPTRAQLPNEPDFDRSRLPLQVIGPNQGANYVVSTLVTLSGGRFEIRAPLVLAAGGVLRIDQSDVAVLGDISLQEGGTVVVTSSTFGVRNSYQSQYLWWFLGGSLVTDRATVGAVPSAGGLFLTTLWLNNGVFESLDTTLQSSAVMMGFGRTGYYGRPDQRGGTLRARRLTHGDNSDAIHMSGQGDVVLEDSTFAIGFFVYADGTAPSAITLDFNSRTPFSHVVYGDPALHQGVTRPVPFMPCRLELTNSRVLSWHLSATAVRDSGQPLTVTLTNADSVLVGVQGINLVGSPVLGGNWSNWYPRLPGLPTTRAPGHHPMPPACSVRIGNVTFQTGSGANDWANIEFWGLYLEGASTDFTVRGAAQIGEVFCSGGRLQLLGDGSFDMGLLTNVIELYGTARATIDNAAMGEFGTDHSVRGLLNVRDSATCTISRSRISDLRLMTWAAGTSIDVSQSLVEGALTQDQSRGGTIRVTAALPTQATDLQNLDFESPPTGPALPPFWAGQSVGGQASTDTWSRSSGTRSFEFQASGFPAALWKDLPLPPETFVDVMGGVKLLQAPPAGAWTELVTAGSGGGSASVRPAATTGVWQLLRVPTYQTARSDTATRVQFRGQQFSAQARLDDWRVQIGSWWDNQHLGNLDFEQPTIHDPGLAPRFATAPDGWRAFSVRSAVEGGAANLRPGTSGQRSLRLSLLDTGGGIHKDLTFLRPGDQLTISGWVKATVVGAYLDVLVGEGSNYFVSSPPNRRTTVVTNGGWQSFSLTYPVPAPPQKQAFTRLAVYIPTGVGSVAYLDDFQVTIQ